jgi:hypothetical protein
MARCVGVCQDNYLAQAPNTFYSSQNPVYPAANVYDLQRRKKVWRSAGYWEVVSGENTLVFRETALTDLTATVAAGEYTTTAAFLAALKTALEAAGDSTYTCTQVDGKIRVVSDGGGGGGIFELILTDAASEDMADLLGFDDSANLTGALTYTADELRAHTSEWLVWDLGIPTNPRALCVVGDRNLPLRISPTATVRLLANTTNSWSAPAVTLTIPAADYSRSTWNLEGFSDTEAGYRYWKLEILDRENPRGYVEIGAVYLGDLMDFTRGAAVFPLERSGLDRSQTVFSEGGQAYALELPKTQGFRIQWQGILKEEAERMWAHWETVGKTRSFFLILDLPEAFTSNAQDWVKLVRFDNDHSDRLLSPNNFEAAWSLLEQL